MAWIAVALFYSAVIFNLVSTEITWIEARFPIGGDPPPPGSPWPYPQSLETKDQMFILDPKFFEIKYDAVGCDVMEKAIERYKKLIFILGNKSKMDDNQEKLKHLQIIVVKKDVDDCQYPKMEVNESYNLTINAIITELKAETVWGALRGLETFSQLVFVDETTKTYHINGTEIHDWPTFSYRGLLLDTARHYQPMKVLKQNLDAMSYNKLNVFHWHLVDDQSWPLVSKLYPNLTDGAYHPRLIYTHEDVKEIIEYARLRGIRVLPEFDTPGHTRALGKAFPGIITPCFGKEGIPFTPNYTEFSEMEILNPILDETYEIVKSIYKEIKGLFKDEYVHLGMDEVYYGCWKSNPDIAEFMKMNDLSTINELEQYYVNRTITNVRDVGYKYMTWQDPVDNDVQMDNETVVQIWKDTSLDSKLEPWHDYIRNISKKGYKMVVSACWYLNYISYGMDWKKYYYCDPQGFDADDSVKNLVIGGEACMWGEYVDATNIISRIWPRASAVAERLWSNSSMNDTDEAQYRLDEQRCRMLRRGLPAKPILNGFCGDYEWDLTQVGPEPCRSRNLTPLFLLQLILLFTLLL